MKEIRGHRSWSFKEIVGMLFEHGSFTMCTLPHYRYAGVKENCRLLERAGFITRKGRTDVAINWVTTDLFDLWKQEIIEGKTKTWPIKWAKQKTA